jgi:hypothetical protein
MKKLKEITKKDMEEYAFCLTVGRLKEFLAENAFPDDAIVVVQRVEDVYYEKHRWGVYLKEGDETQRVQQHNEDIKSGKYLNKEKYPGVTKENLKPFSPRQIQETMNQYHPAWSCVKYKDDDNVLFIDLHY